MFNPSRPNNDLSRTSHCNIKGLSDREVTRIENIIFLLIRFHSSITVSFCTYLYKYAVSFSSRRSKHLIFHTLAHRFKGGFLVLCF